MDRTLYDITLRGVDVSEEGEDILEMAERLGIDVLGISMVAGNKDSEVFRERIEDLKDSSEAVDVYPGIVVDPDHPKELRDTLSGYRDDFYIVTVEGGEEKVNRAACEDSRVDVLMSPGSGRRDSGMNHVLAKKASENRVAVGVDFGGLVRYSGKRRSQLLQKISKNYMLAEKYGAPLVAGSNATRPVEMRKPRDMIGLFSGLCGAEVDEAYRAVSEHPENVIERAMNAFSEGFIRPGLKEVSDD